MSAPQVRTSQTPPKRIVFWILVAAVVAVIGTFGAMFIHEIRAPATSRANLQQISMALPAYHAAHNSFPPAYVLGSNGERYHSWRVLLLPYLGENRLYDQYRFDEPWNSVHNQALSNKMPNLYGSPYAKSRKPGIANYLAIVGRATAWPEQFAIRRDDIHDDPTLTIQLVESADSDIVWLEPRDISHQQALRQESPVNYPTPSSNRADHFIDVAMADGRVRRISQDMHPPLFAAWLTISGGRWFDRGDWPPRGDSAIALPAPRSAAELSATDIVPVPTGSIVAGRNYVYCSTFQLAWEDARQAIFSGGPLAFEDAMPLADALNHHTFARSNIAESSYIARGGPGSAEFRLEILSELNRKFPGADPALISQGDDDHVVLVYAYLFKSLPFGAEFDSLLVPLEFHHGNNRNNVASFGVRNLDDFDSHGKKMQAQVTIVDYVNDDDFVVQLTPTGPRDEIVLAKVKPRQTLEETITAVRERIARPSAQHHEKRMFRAESLVVPKLTANVVRRFFEIKGKHLAGVDLYVADALQVIRFRLDETGARLESEATISFDDGHDPTPPGERNFIFDRPFLVYLIEKQADQPYFAMWIENPELMTPFAK